MMNAYLMGYQRVLRLAMGCFLLCVFPSFASSFITIYTPNRTEITGYLFVELSQAEIEKKDRQFEEMIRQNGWHAKRIKSSSGRYNGHGYAWHMSQGGGEVVIDDNDVPWYWQDGSYRQIDENEAAEGDIIVMTDPENPSGFHSAIVAGDPGWCKSKWYDGPVFLHKFEEHPFGKTLKFYRRVKPAAPLNLRIVE